MAPCSCPAALPHQPTPAAAGCQRAAPCRDCCALEVAHGAAAKPLEVLVGATNRLGQLLSEGQQEALMQVGGRVRRLIALDPAQLTLPACPAFSRRIPSACLTTSQPPGPPI